MRNFPKPLLLISLVFACVGCATGRWTSTSPGATASLVESVRHYDPPITEISSAYYRGEEVVIAYLLVGRTNGHEKQTFQYRRYWAMFSCKDRSEESGIVYHIHREALNPSVVQGWSRVNVRDLSGNIAVQSDGYFNQSEYIDFLHAIPDSELPMIGYLRKTDPQYPVPIIDNKNMTLVYIDPQSLQRTILQGEPRSKYIPAKNYPKLIIQFPFMLIMDLLLALGSG